MSEITFKDVFIKYAMLKNLGKSDLFTETFDVMITNNLKSYKTVNKLKEKNLFDVLFSITNEYYMTGSFNPDSINKISETQDKELCKFFKINVFSEWLINTTSFAKWYEKNK